MNWLDIVIIVAVAITTFFGLRLGIIKAGLSLAGLIVSVVLARHYYVTLSHQLSFISDENMAKVAAYAIILAGVTIIAMVLASLLKRITSLMTLGWVNRVGGATFGLALGAIFCGAVLATWVKLLGIQSVVSESIAAAMLLDNFPLVLALLPEELYGVHSFFQ